MADTDSPSSQLKVRPLKKKNSPRRASAPVVPSKYLNMSTSIVANADEDEMSVFEETNNSISRLLMSRSFVSTNFMDDNNSCRGGGGDDASIADLSSVVSLQILAKATMNNLGRGELVDDSRRQDEEEEEEEQAEEADSAVSPKSDNKAGSGKSKSKSKSKRESRRISTSPRRDDNETEVDQEDKKSRRKSRASGSPKRDSEDQDENKETKEDMDERKSRRKSRASTRPTRDMETKEDQDDKKSRRKSRASSSPKRDSEEMEDEEENDQEDKKSKRRSRSKGKSFTLEELEERIQDKKSKHKSHLRSKSFSLDAMEEETHTKQNVEKKTKPKSKSFSNLQALGKEVKGDDRTKERRRGNSSPKHPKDYRDANVAEEGQQRESKSRRGPRTNSKRKSTATPKKKQEVNGDEAEPCVGASGGAKQEDQEFQERASKSKRAARTTSRRKSTATPATHQRIADDENDTAIDDEKIEEKEECEKESKSRHSMRGPRLCPRPRSTSALSKLDNEDQNKDETTKSPKGRMRRSKSHELAIKKKTIRKTKSMDEKTALLNLDVDADDDTVLANNRSADSSPARRVRSTVRRSSLSGTAPVGSITPTNLRVTRRRASLTASVTEAMAEVATAAAGVSADGATTPGTNTPTSTRRTRRLPSGSRSTSGSSTPSSAPSSSRNRGRRTSTLVGGHQLRQALQQEPNLTPAVLMDLDDDVKFDDKVESKPKLKPAPDNKQKVQTNTMSSEDTGTDMETDASEQASISMRLPTAYQQQDRSRMDPEGMDGSDSNTTSSLEIRSRRSPSVSDRLSSSSHHGRSTSAVLPSTTDQALSSSCEEPRSSSAGAVPSSSDHGTRKAASSRLSISRSQDALSMFSSFSSRGPVRSSLSSKPKKDLSSSSDHGGQRKSWFSFSRQSDPLDLPSSSGHGPSKRSASPSRRAAMQQRGSTTESMNASSSSGIHVDLMNASTSSGFVLPMVQGVGGGSKRGRRNSLPSRPKEKKVSLLLPRNEKLDDLYDDDSDASDDDFAY